MNIVAIYGTEHKGSTYNISQMFLRKVKTETSEIKEFFLPKDMPHFCRGCGLCFGKGEGDCPHYKEISPIKEAIEKADLLLFASPVYVYHTTGQMKTLLDHFGYQWMPHRPNPPMFSKMALVVTTAAGAGMKSTSKDITDSLSFWGVGKIFKFGKAVAAINWEGVSGKKKEEIEKQTDKLALKIIKKSSKVNPSLKVKFLFYVMRIMQKKLTINPVDKEYWEKQGWLGSKRPW
jgi:multimeric flavodoxin WrbA